MIELPLHKSEKGRQCQLLSTVVSTKVYAGTTRPAQFYLILQDFLQFWYVLRYLRVGTSIADYLS